MKISKKLLISLFIIITILSACALYQTSYAIATPEMDATGISLKNKNVGEAMIFCTEKM